MAPTKEKSGEDKKSPVEMVNESVEALAQVTKRHSQSIAEIKKDVHRLKALSTSAWFYCSGTTLYDTEGDRVIAYYCSPGNTGERLVYVIKKGDKFKVGYLPQRYGEDREYDGLAKAMNDFIGRVLQR